MSVDMNVAAVQRAKAGRNAGNLAAYLELCASDPVVHGYDGVELGITGIRRYCEDLWAAFPDSRPHFDDVVAAGDKVANRFTWSGVHRGAFQSLQASGRAVSMTGIIILRFAGGRCAERWSQADYLGPLRQLGVLPAATGGDA
jgi:predicted ester cyclase